jgi:murein DD-endopeptidase MepM/ murein hydrolase activator NlpD
MVMPIKGKSVTTAYGKRGKHWSCNKNSAGEGVHTGADIAAPVGTTVIAMRPGKVRHVNYGSAFGTKQVAITGPDGTEDFYAHMRSRVASGTMVKTGQKIGEVGTEGNTTGPHLHFERHKSPGSWNCSNHVDPKPSINYKDSSPAIKPGPVYLS